MSRWTLMLKCEWASAVAGPPSRWRVKVWRRAWCRNGAFVNPFLTYICGFLLSQLKFLLGVFKSRGVLVQLILSSIQLLLQSYQIVLKLRRVSVARQFQRWSARSCVNAHRRKSAYRETNRTGRERTGQEKKGKREEKLGKLMHVRIRYLGGDLLSGQHLFLSSLELLKHFISFIFSNAQFLFQLSYIVL